MDFFEFLPTEFVACWKPPSRVNHHKAPYPRTQQRDQVEPRPFDQGRCKNDAFTHSSTLPTKVSQKRRNFMKLITKGCWPSLPVSPGGVCIKKRPKHNVPSTSSQIKQQNFDKRSPGLFKLEWDGTGFIGLCSKTYFSFGVKDKQVSKLVKVKQNQFNLSNSTFLDY